MVLASQLRPGMAVRYEHQEYKVLAADYHPGQGKMGGVLHARLRSLTTGTLWEHSFRAELKLDELAVEKRSLVYLYADPDACYFMDPESYEQIAVPLSMIGDQARLLQPDLQVPVEFVEGRPVSVEFPSVLEVKITDTAPPLHQQDGAWKAAKLESGIEIMVPPFIKSGDAIRLDVPNLKYMDRVKTAAK
jgi:elongation factor P